MRFISKIIIIIISIEMKSEKQNGRKENCFRKKRFSKKETKNKSRKHRRLKRIWTMIRQGQGFSVAIPFCFMFISFCLSSAADHITPCCPIWETVHEHCNKSVKIIIMHIDFNCRMANVCGVATLPAINKQMI